MGVHVAGGGAIVLALSDSVAAGSAGGWACRKPG